MRMADLAASAPAGASDAATVQATESDFSPRKIKIATVILLGQTFASSLLPFMALGYVLPYMTQEFGWSRGEFLLANSFLMWFGALTLWPMGVFTDKIGARPIILLGTLGVGIVTLLLQFVHNAPAGPLPRAWMFYVLFALLGVFGSSGASYAKVITSLFTQNRGKAMAILNAEGTIARVILPVTTTWLLITYGWRGMFTTFGVVILLIVPLVFFFLEEPGTRGLKPSLKFKRPAAAANAGAGAVVIPFEGMTFAEVRRDGVFWLMLVGGLVSMVVGNGMGSNIPASFHDRGFSMTTIGLVDSLSILAGIPGVLLAGFLMDKIHSTKIAVPFHLVTALSAFMMMVVTPQFGGFPLLLASRLLFMFAFTSVLPLNAYFMTRFFGLKSFAQLYGFMSAIQAMCMGFAPPLFGHIYDVTHSYQIGYEALIASAIFAAAVFLILPRYRFSANIGAMPAAPKLTSEGEDAATVPAE
jgi:MFS family permease